MFNFVDSIVKTHGVQPVPTPADVKKFTDENAFGYNIGNQYADPDQQDLSQIYKLLPIVYRCINIRATNLASLPYRIVTKDKDGKETDISGLVPLLTQRQNNYQSTHDFWEESSIRLDSQGELFWNLDRGKDGQIIAIYADWRSEEIKVVGDEKKKYGKYIRTVNGDELEYRPSDVFFIKYLDPVNVLRGLSPLQAGKNNIILQLGAFTFLKKFFEQGMHTGGVFYTDQNLKGDNLLRLKEELQSKHGGVNNMHKSLMVWAGLKYQAFNQMNMNEAALMPLIDMNQEDISNIYGIPPEIIASGNRTYENMPAAMRYLWEQTLQPHIAKISSQINTFLLPQLLEQSRYDNAEFKADYSSIPALKADMERKARIFDMGMRNGSVSVNETRKHVYGFEPLDGPENDIPVSLPATVPTSVPPDGGTEGKVLTKAQTDELTAVWKEKMISIEAFEDTLKSKMIAFFARQESVVLKKFENSFKDFPLMKSRQKVFDDILNIQFWAEDLKGVVEPTLIAIVIASAKEWLGTGTLDTTHPSVRTALGERVRKYSERINKHTKILIQEALRDGFEAGESIASLKERITGVFSKASEGRAALIARTEAVGAANLGIQKGLEQGEFPYKQWITSRDSHVRDAHQIDGQVVPTDAYFRLDDGRLMIFPMDFNERCIMRGVRTPNG